MDSISLHFPDRHFFDTIRGRDVANSHRQCTAPFHVANSTPPFRTGGIPDAHLLEAHSRQSPIKTDGGEFGKFVAICEAAAERPPGGGGRRGAAREGVGCRGHVPLCEGTGRNHAELRRPRPGFRESEIDGMNGGGGQRAAPVSQLLVDRGAAGQARSLQSVTRRSKKAGTSRKVTVCGRRQNRRR